MPHRRDRPRRRVPWVGIILIALVIGAIIAFGVFKRKGSRKPPPIPEEHSVFVPVNGPGCAA